MVSFFFPAKTNARPSGFDARKVLSKKVAETLKRSMLCTSLTDVYCANETIYMHLLFLASGMKLGYDHTFSYISAWLSWKESLCLLYDVFAIMKLACDKEFSAVTSKSYKSKNSIQSRLSTSMPEHLIRQRKPSQKFNHPAKGWARVIKISARTKLGAPQAISRARRGLQLYSLSLSHFVLMCQPAKPASKQTHISVTWLNWLCGENPLYATELR